MANTIGIGGELEPKTTEKIGMRTDFIKDDTQNKTQKEINSSTATAITDLAQEVSKTSDLIVCTNEKGLHLIDNNKNVGFKFGTDGKFDAIGFGDNLAAILTELIEEIAPEQDLSVIEEAIQTLKGKSWVNDCFASIREDGLYIVDSDGNVGFKFGTDGKFDAIALGENLKQLIGNSDVIESREAELNKTQEELRKLKDETEMAINSLVGMKKGEPTFTKTITIPSVGYDRNEVIVRIGLHYGNNLANRSALNNDVFFGGNCNKDFSDVRVLDSDGNILNKKVLHSGNYEVYEDSQFTYGCNVVNDINGNLYKVKSSIIYKSTDGGATFTQIANPSGKIFDLLGVDSRNYLYFCQKDEEYNRNSLIRMLKLNESFDQNDAITVCDIFTAGWQSTKEIANEDEFMQPSRVGIKELDGYIFFGRYQEEYNPTLYRSLNNTMTPVNGEYFKVCYNMTPTKPETTEAKTAYGQHIHNIYVHQATHQVFIGIDDSLRDHGPHNLVSNDYGDTWNEWTIDNDVDWKMQRSRDYIPQYIASDGSFMLGGGETSILNGITTVKITNSIVGNKIVPTKCTPVNKSAYGTRGGSAFDDNFIIIGGNSGKGTNLSNLLNLSTDKGDTWKTIWNRVCIKATNMAGWGPRYFTKPFIPNGDTEQVIYVSDSEGGMNALRVVRGGSHYYGEAIVNVGSIASGQTKTITICNNYAMAQPNKEVRSRDVIKPVYSIKLNECYGDKVLDSNGVYHKIVGDFKWDDYNTNQRFGEASPHTGEYNDHSGLLLAEGSYIELGKIPQLNFNKGFSIMLWAKVDEALGNKEYIDERLVLWQVVLSNSEFMFALHKNGFALGNKSKYARCTTSGVRNNYGTYLPFVITIDNDGKSCLYIGDSHSGDPVTVPASWNFGNLSEKSLRIGCQSVSTDVLTIRRYISDIRIFDKVLTREEARALFQGGYYN